MKLVLKFVTIMLATVTLVMPLLEFFDRWDAPGLSNDTEFPVFLVVLLVALVMLAVGAMARRALDQQRDTLEISVGFEPCLTLVNARTDIAIAPHMSPPLRI